MTKPEDEHTSEPSKVPPIEANITLLTPKDSTTSPERHSIRYFEASVSLVKAFAWPILVLFLFLILRVPISAILEELPSKVSQSTKISVGSLSFEIQQTAKAAGSPELGQLIGGLSSQAIEKLLNTARSRQALVGTGPVPNVYTFPNKIEMKAILELEKKGLLEFEIPRKEFEQSVENLHLKKENEDLGGRIAYGASPTLGQGEEQRLRQQTYFLTKLGERAFDLIVGAVVQQLQAPSEGNTTEREKKK